MYGKRVTLPELSAVVSIQQRTVCAGPTLTRRGTKGPQTHAADIDSGIKEDFKSPKRSLRLGEFFALWCFRTSKSVWA